MKKFSILDMPEDLLDEGQPSLRSTTRVAKTKGETSQQSQPVGRSSLDTLLTEVANDVGVPVQELRDWAQEVMVPEATLKLILKTAKHYQLNPLFGQIGWEQNPEGDYEVFILIDGWITLIHRESSFQGITFSPSSETENGIPLWVECTIYRSDLTHPITVREYYAENKTAHPIWQQKPCRMLRHKTLQQCARIAFGISAPELKIPKIPIITKNISNTHLSQGHPSQKVLLKQKLSISQS